jgi:electron transport complex protein RnfB
VKESYQKLVNHLMKTSLSPPDAETLYKMVESRVTPEEADFLAKIPFRRLTPSEISQKTGIPAEELIKKLDELALKGVIYRIKGEDPNENRYSLADVMFGWYRMPWWSGKKDDYHRNLAPITNKYYIDQLGKETTGYPT